MTRVSTTELRNQFDETDLNYLEVLSEDSMTVELARYPNPAPKTPHNMDELYYIISGSGMAHVGNERFAIGEGDVIYVEQGLEHDFFDIEDELTALIVFTGGDETVLGRKP